MSTKSWFIDSSVALGAVRGESPAAQVWFDTVQVREEPMCGSQMLLLEVDRTLCNQRLLGTQRVTPDLQGVLLGELEILDVDNALLVEAAAIQQVLRSTDAIHVASALRLGPEEVAVVTHDAQMARACQSLGFQVHDPVTDDPRRPPVA